MKLELKHIAPYFPYGLKCQCMGLHVDEYAENPIPVVVEIVGISTEYVEIHEIGRTVTEQYYLSDIFPILLPLSDLTKEIEVNGERFVPIDRLNKLIECELGCNTEILWLTDNSALGVTQEIIPYTEKLFEWHFDLYNLIENGLAININTLQQ